MKKLLKYEWRRYLVLILFTAVFLIGDRIYKINAWGAAEFELKYMVQDYSEEFDLESGYESDVDEENILVLPYMITNIATQISYGFLDFGNICIVIIMLFLAKSLRYWDERNIYGREFVVTLPVKGRIRKGFYVTADIVFVISSVMLYTVGILAYTSKVFADNAIELPWLNKAVIGEMLICIAYLLMLLGVIEFLEILFVDGGIKAGGIVVVLVMLRYLLETGADAFYKTEWVQDVYGFLSLEKAGNQYVSTEHGLIEWTHAITNPEILFQGTSLTEVIMEKSRWTVEDIMQFAGNAEFSRMYNFIHISTYAGYVLGYLAIGCMMMGIAIWLAGKIEASKSGFYFAFGRYLISVLIGGTFFVVCIGTANAFWHKMIIAVAAVSVTVLLIYKMNPEQVTVRSSNNTQL